MDGPSPAGFVDIIETVDSGYYEKIEIFSTFPLHHQSMRVSVDYAMPLDHRMAVPKTDLDANAYVKTMFVPFCITFLTAHRPELRFIEEIPGQSEKPEEYGDEASLTGTDTPSSPSQENESSFSENEPPSTKGDKSSKSHPSSSSSSSGSSSSTAKNQGLASSSSGQGAASGGSGGIVTGYVFYFQLIKFDCEAIRG